MFSRHYSPCLHFKLLVVLEKSLAWTLITRVISFSMEIYFSAENTALLLCYLIKNSSFVFIIKKTIIKYLLTVSPPMGWLECKPRNVSILPGGSCPAQCCAGAVWCVKELPRRANTITALVLIMYTETCKNSERNDTKRWRRSTAECSQSFFFTISTF